MQSLVASSSTGLPVHCQVCRVQTGDASSLSSDIRFNAKQNLADLHWMSVRGRNQYKTVLLTFKSLHIDPSTYCILPKYFNNSERHHVISAPATIVCFTMLGPELFSAVAHSATPLRQFRTHYLLSLLIGLILTTCFYLFFKMQPQNVFLQTFIRDQVTVTVAAPAIRFFKV